MEHRTVTAVLDAPKDDVFAYLAEIDNLPRWANEFARELKHEGGKTKVVNGLGEFYFELDADPETGVIDMYAGPSEDELALFPTRVVELPEGYLAAARSLTLAHGALLIVDEIQTGAGRTGAWFGFSHEGITPDAITLAKGIGGGFPIGALVTYGAASALFTPGSHGSTFSGNPLGTAGLDTYTAAKGALNTLTRSMAVEYAPEGVRVNCIVSGMVLTSEGAFKMMDDPVIGGATKAMHLTRLGLPEDIANAALFLASDEAAFVTGAILPVDGGVTARMPVPDISAAVYRAYQSGDRARALELQRPIAEAVAACRIGVFPAAYKAQFALKGLCERHMARPIPALHDG